MDYKNLENTLGYTFRDAALLKRALTHSSYASENRQAAHNERLEFLGDAVLEVIVSEWLYKREPPLSEGVMTRERAGLVCEGSFADAARRARIGDYLLLGRGEAQSNGRKKPSILADAFEAVIGAVYLDGGADAARETALRLLEPQRSLQKTAGANMDAKSRLQEIMQKNGREPARYAVIKEDGPPHNRTFTVAVYFGGKVIGTGLGRTKKEAEQAAAAEGLEIYMPET